MIYIYKIFNDDVSYIGSTKNFKDRMKCHKARCNNENLKEYNLFIYQYIRTHGGWDQFTKEIIHTCDVVDKTEQRMIEQEFIKTNECKLNGKNSYQTIEELKESARLRANKYRKANKDKVREKKKEYREANKEKLKEKKKEYREANKDKIREKKNQKFTCECGGTYTHSNKTAHERSNKHIQFIESK